MSPRAEGTVGAYRRGLDRRRRSAVFDFGTGRVPVHLGNVRENALDGLRGDEMITTVEISMYPFRENYRDVIKSFVARLNGYEGLRVTTGPTSTVIIGEYGRVMQSLTEILAWSHGEHGRAVFVAKFIPDYEPE